MNSFGRSRCPTSHEKEWLFASVSTRERYPNQGWRNLRDWHSFQNHFYGLKLRRQDKHLYRTLYCNSLFFPSVQVPAVTPDWWGLHKFSPCIGCRGSHEVAECGRRAGIPVEESGEGELARLTSDSRLSQLELDYATCELFIVTSWKAFCKVITANQQKSWVFCFPIS